MLHSGVQGCDQSQWGAVSALNSFVPGLGQKTPTLSPVLTEDHQQHKKSFQSTPEIHTSHPPEPGTGSSAAFPAQSHQAGGDARLLEGKWSRGWGGCVKLSPHTEQQGQDGPGLLRTCPWASHCLHFLTSVQVTHLLLSCSHSRAYPSHRLSLCDTQV